MLKVLVIAIRQEKGIKEIKTGEEEAKLSLLADDRILSFKDSMESTGKLLGLILKVAGYKKIILCIVKESNR